jgi:heme/copper-type cytochrome/quinol oxidase subunit 2
MNTLIQIKKQFIVLLFIVITPLVTLAQQSKTAEDIAKEAKEEAADIARWQMIGMIGTGVLFVGGVTAFLVYKTKHDKALREKQIEQMKKVMAAKKRTS